MNKRVEEIRKWLETTALMSQTVVDARYRKKISDLLSHIDKIEEAAKPIIKNLDLVKYLHDEHCGEVKMKLIRKLAAAIEGEE